MRIPFFSAPAIITTPARVTDAAGLAAVHAEGGFSSAWGADEFESLLTDASIITDNAVDSQGRGAVHGFVMSRIAHDEAEILTIAVRRKRRRLGLGRRLLDVHIARLAAKGVKILFLEVEEHNEPALSLYGRYGFIPVGRREAYYRKTNGQSAAAIIMKYELGRV